MFLLSGDKFMPEMHLRQAGVTYSTYGSLKKQNKDANIQWNKRHLIQLSEWTRQSLFSVWCVIPVSQSLHTFRKSLDESGHKPNKMWLELGWMVCKKSMKSQLHDNDIWLPHHLYKCMHQ